MEKIWWRRVGNEKGREKVRVGLCGVFGEGKEGIEKAEASRMETEVIREDTEKRGVEDGK